MTTHTPLIMAPHLDIKSHWRYRCLYPDTQSVMLICCPPFQSAPLSMQVTRRESLTHLRLLPGSVRKDFLLLKVARSTGGSTQLRVDIPTFREAALDTCHNVDEQVHIPLLQGLPHTGHGPVEIRSRDMAELGFPEILRPHAPPTSKQGDHDGRLPDRLVRSSSPHQSLGPVATRVQPISHKLAGTDGYSSDIRSLSPRDSGSHGNSLVRQHHSASVHQETRVS